MLASGAITQVGAGSLVVASVGAPVCAVAGATLGAINAGALSSYVAAHTYPSYYYQGDVVVGATLPQGVTYYRVPTDYYGPAYYTIVNGHTVLVDPNSGKILQVMN